MNSSIQCDENIDLHLSRIGRVPYHQLWNTSRKVEKTLQNIMENEEFRTKKKIFITFIHKNDLN